MPARHQILRASLAPHQQNSELGQLLLDGRQQSGAAAQARHSAIAEKIGQLVSDQTGAPLARDKGRAGDQRHPDLLDREVEGDRHALVDAISGNEPVQLGGHPVKIADAGMLDDDPFRLTGRSRRIDDVADPIDGGSDFAVGEARRRFRVDIRFAASR